MKEFIWTKRKEPALPNSVISRRTGINKAVGGEKVCIVSACIVLEQDTYESSVKRRPAQ